MAPAQVLPARRRNRKAAAEGKEEDEIEDKYKGLTKDNIFKKLSSAKGKKKQICLEYLDDFAAEIVKSRTFIRAPKDIVLFVVKRESINISEVELFDAVMVWGQAELKAKSVAATPAALKAELADIIPFIRFPTMNTEDIASKIAATGLLEQQQILDLFTYLAQKDMGAKPGKSLAVFIDKPRKGGGSTKCSPPPEASPYQEPFTGVFHMLATGMGKKPFTNPHTAGLLRMYAEPGATWSGGITEVNLVDSLTSGRALTSDSYMNATWFAVDLNTYRWQPTHYAMKNGGGRGLVLRDWTIEGKATDSDDWTVLRRYTNDGIYANDGQNGFGLHVFAIDEAHTKKWFKHVRIVRTDGKRSFYVHRWELYGAMKKMGK